MLAATGYSLDGLKSAFQTETAFRQETAALLALPLAAFFLGVPCGQIALVTGGWLALMAVELLNSGLEALCNLVSPEFHPLVKKAKDGGSAAVFLAICANVCLWFYIGLPLIRG